MFYAFHIYLAILWNKEQGELSKKADHVSMVITVVVRIRLAFL